MSKPAALHLTTALRRLQRLAVLRCLTIDAAEREHLDGRVAVRVREVNHYLSSGVRLAPKGRYYYDLMPAYRVTGLLEVKP